MSVLVSEYITGILVTYFFVPDMTGVDLADEDMAFVKYLAENEWEGEVGDGENGVPVNKEEIEKN